MNITTPKDITIVFNSESEIIEGRVVSVVFKECSLDKPHRYSTIDLPRIQVLNLVYFKKKKQTLSTVRIGIVKIHSSAFWLGLQLQHAVDLLSKISRYTTLV